MKIHAGQGDPTGGSGTGRSPAPPPGATPTPAPPPAGHSPAPPPATAPQARGHQAARPDFEAALHRLQRDELENCCPSVPRSPQVAIQQEGGCFVLQPQGQPPCAVALARVRSAGLTPPARQGRDGEVFSPAGRVAAGLHDQGAALLYLLLGDGANVELYMGVRGSAPSEAAAASTAMRICLTANYSNVQLQPVAAVGELKALAERLSAVPYAASMVGDPSAGALADPAASPTDKLIRALAGSRYALVVHAEPLGRQPVAAMAAAIAREVAEAHRHVRWSASQAQTGVWQGHESREEVDYFAQQYEQQLLAQGARLDAGLREGLWRTTVTLLTESQSACRRLGALLRATFGGADSRPQPVRVLFHAPSSGAASQLARMRPIESDASAAGPGTLATDLSSTELGLLTELPRREAPGFGLSRPREFAVDVPARGGRTVTIGTVLNSGQLECSQLAIDLDDLTRHTLIVGVTGSGKTTTALHLLRQLWTVHHVPFLVIEPAKSHYRQLLGVEGFEQLQVFSPGRGQSAPFRMNPFAFPPGVHPQTHVSHLYSVFSAAFVLYPPMPYVLERSLCEVYEDRRWDLAGGTHPEADPATGRPASLAFPTLSDLYEKIGHVVDSLGYGERLRMDVTAGLQARVDSLRVGQKGLTFDCRYSTPFGAILDRPTVLELSHVGSDEEKSFLIGLLLIRLYEMRESAGDVPHLQHVTMVEEAHRLLSRVSSGPADNAGNPRGQAVEAFCNLLAEIRAYGEGIVIAEQIPTKLAPDVLKNTNLKVLHRVVAADDREAMAGAMNLLGPQNRAVTSLTRGEAVVYAEGLEQPALVRVPPPPVHRAVDQQAIESAAAAFYRTHASCLAQFAGCAHCKDVCRYAARVKRTLSTPTAFHAVWALAAACADDPACAAGAYQWLPGRLRVEPAVAAACATGRDDLRWCYCTLAAESAAWEARRATHATLGQTAQMTAAAVSLLGAARDGQSTIAPAQSLADQLGAMARRPSGPLAGCQACGRVCLYRPLARPVSLRKGILPRFSKALDEEDPKQAVRRLCQRLAEGILPPGSTRSADALGLCILAHLLDAVGSADPERHVQAVYAP